MKNQEFSEILGQAVYNLNEQTHHEAKAYFVRIGFVEFKFISEPDTEMKFKVSKPHILLEDYISSLVLKISLKPYGDIKFKVYPGYMERIGNSNKFKFTSRNGGITELSF